MKLNYCALSPAPGIEGAEPQARVRSDSAARHPRKARLLFATGDNP